ncbi:MAG TPA: hypothetical protein VKP88_04235 [Candidatus Paceibacterota bacterium]|nr:hypothetical protein [Candidatus Paceibacterota bacterium]
MATTASPYGLRPVRRLDGMPYAGATTEYLIDPAGEATNLFYGQVVILGSDGYVALATATGADITTNNLGGANIGALGVFVGCEYTNAEGQRIHSQYYPSGVSNGGSIKAKVVDDPSVLFQAQLDDSGGQTVIGTNTTFAAVQSTSTGSTTTGVSTTALDATVATTAKAFRIVAHVGDPTDAYPDVLVAFNTGAHRYNASVGL